MKMRHFTSLFVLFFAIRTLSLAQSESAILGVWYNTEKTAQVEIQKKGAEFIGKIVWLKEPIQGGKPLTDNQNPDPKLKTRPMLGLPLLTGLKYSSGIWKGGEIYDPTSGKTYSCELKLKSPEILEVKGYLGFSFVGRTVEWTKVKR